MFERVLSDGASVLRAQARRHSAQGCDAEDALQEGCLQFLRYYQGGPGTQALRWLMLCVKHRAWEIKQRRARRQAFVALSATDVCGEATARTAPAAAADPTERAERAEEFAASRAALARLKPDERRALLLLGFGYSYREICEITGWTYTKVNRCIAEGRAALREDGSGS